MISLATKQIEIRATSVRVSGDALIVDLSMDEQCQRCRHGIRDSCMAPPRNEMTINLSATVLGFIGRS
jgi:predicted signal transduction protein with EAL and GGDEF domain